MICRLIKEKTVKTNLCRVSGMLAIMFLAVVSATAADHKRDMFVLTSTNNASGNDVVVFKLDTAGTPSLSLVDMLPTGGNGGASTNAGVLQFRDDLGAVANYGSNSVSQLVRDDGSIGIGRTIKLSPGCVNPDSVALTEEQLFVVGTKCAESHAWPSGMVDGAVVGLADTSAAQIAVGKTWAAVTLTSGSVLQLPLTQQGTLSGASTTVTLPSNANSVPLGAAFWRDILGFTPAHSVDSFAIVDENGTVFPIADRHRHTPLTPPAGWLRGQGARGIRAIPPGMLSRYSSATDKAGHFTNPCPCRAYRLT